MTLESKETVWDKNLLAAILKVSFLNIIVMLVITLIVSR
jgi:hypothetical protein